MNASKKKSIFSRIRSAVLLFTAFAILLMLPALADPSPIAALTTKTNIKVAVNCSLPPFQYVDEHGKLVGLHIDMMDHIADAENLSVEYVRYDTNSGAMEALQNGSVDAILGFLSSSGIPSSLTATRDISSASLCMLVENDYTTRVLHPETNPQKYVVGFEIDTINLQQMPPLNTMCNVIVGNQLQLYKTLMDKNVNAVIGVKESMLFLLEHDSGAENHTIVNNYISSVNYRILTRKDERVLCGTLNRSINQLRTSEDYERILIKWVGSIETEAMRAKMRRIMMGAVVLFGVSGVAFINVAFINHRLKKLVAEKTSEIQSRVHQLETESILRKRLIEYSPGGILLLKADGSVVMMNSIARAISGVSDSEIGDKVCNIHDVNVLGELWDQIPPENLEEADLPLIAKLGNGHVNRIFRLQCSSINAAADKVLMVEDITREEEEKQERFELQKNKSLNRVIAGMAHEIKNPLMAIRTFASLIPRQGNDTDFQSMFAEHVPKEVERINRLIELLINYTRPSKSQKELVPTSEIVNDSAYYAHITASNPHIDFQLCEKAQAQIFINRDQIKQSMINLILNSIQSVEERLASSPEEPKAPLVIRVSSCRKNGQIYLEVYDEGCGMTEAELEKCMDPFFSTKPDGLGMGLALTKQFVQESSGRLEFDSIKNEFTKICMIFEEETSK